MCIDNTLSTIAAPNAIWFPSCQERTGHTDFALGVKILLSNQICFIKDVNKAKLSPKDNIKPCSGHKLLMQTVLYSRV